MRYFITGIDVAKGTVDDDVTDARPYFELGWEVVTTHLDVKRLKREGRVDAALDTVVTCSGREFLYTAEFARVIDHDAFLAGARPGDEKVYLTDRYAPGQIPLDYFEGDRHSPSARYKHFDADRGAIQNVGAVDVSALHGGLPYACLLIRRRAHGPGRNMSDAIAHGLIEHLASRYGRVFIVGRDIDSFAGDGVVHVDLRTYASLIRDDLCDVIVGSFTGPMQIAALLSRARTSVVLNYDGYDVATLNDPLILGHCVRYSPTEFVFMKPETIAWLIAHHRLPIGRDGS